MREDEAKRQIFGLICRGDHLRWFVGSLQPFAGILRSFVVVCCRLLVVFGGLWSFVVVSCFSNYNLLIIFSLSNIIYH